MAMFDPIRRRAARGSMAPWLSSWLWGGRFSIVAKVRSTTREACFSYEEKFHWCQMTIDLADFLIGLGAIAILMGAFHFSPWAGVMLSGAYLIVTGLILAHQNAHDQTNPT